jgi:hypothetical protein
MLQVLGPYLRKLSNCFSLRGKTHIGKDDEAVSWQVRMEIKIKKEMIFPIKTA